MGKFEINIPPTMIDPDGTRYTGEFGGSNNNGGFITEFIEEETGFTIDGCHFEPTLDMMNDLFVLSDAEFTKLWNICQNKLLIYRVYGVWPAELLHCDIDSYADSGEPNCIMLYTGNSMSMHIGSQSYKNNIGGF